MIEDIRLLDEYDYETALKDTYNFDIKGELVSAMLVILNNEYMTNNKKDISYDDYYCHLTKKEILKFLDGNRTSIIELLMIDYKLTESKTYVDYDECIIAFSFIFNIMYTHLLSLLTEMCNECIDLDIDIVHKHPIVDYFSVLYMEKTMEYYYENVEEPKTLIRDEYDNIAYGISVHEMAQEIKLNRFITCNDMRYFYLSKIMKEEKNK